MGKTRKDEQSLIAAFLSIHKGFVGLLTSQTVQQRTPFFIAVLLGSLGWSFGWIIVLCQAYIHFVLAPKRCCSSDSAFHVSFENEPWNSASNKTRFPECNHMTHVDAFEFMNSANDTYKRAEGMLYIRSISASNVRASRWYCSFYLAIESGEQVGEKLQTQPTIENSQNPEWNTGFELPVMDEHGCWLVLEIWDSDKLGEARVLLSKLISSSKENSSEFPLLDQSKVSQGSIFISAGYTHHGQDFEPEGDFEQPERAKGMEEKIRIQGGKARSGPGLGLMMFVQAHGLTIVSICLAYFFGSRRYVIQQQHRTNISVL
jgi:hypothetical protein